MLHHKFPVNTEPKEEISSALGGAKGTLFEEQLVPRLVNPYLSLWPFAALAALRFLERVPLFLCQRALPAPRMPQR